MVEAYIDSFLQLSLITGLIVVFLIGFYLLLGLLRDVNPEEQSAIKRQGYTGGKAISGRRPVFKTIFFQYAIYFLIFDVVAFVTALVGFSDIDWNLSLPLSWGQTGAHVLVYLSIILFLFLILPKTQEEIM